MRKKKNAFTLIELLAVIVILAVILVISIPRILDVIEESKKDSFKSTAQLIADSAEKKKASNKLLDKDESITCKDVAKISDEDYASCTISFDESGIAKVSILGKGKFKGLKVIDGTKGNADVIEITKPTYGLATEYITNLYEYYNDEYNLKVDNTKDQNIRYYGANPNNYVSFNNELWRIIGVFGNNVKLVRKDSLDWLSWDTSDESVNSGYGINQWGESTDEEGNYYPGADLQVYLNKMYYGGDTTITCYGGQSNAEKTCPKDSKGNFLTIDETYKSLIDNHTWNTAAIDYNIKANTLAVYDEERGTKIKLCTDAKKCNDNIIRTTEWTGYIGLPYATDWAYATENTICETNMEAKDSSNISVCPKNNWMYRSFWTWYLSPIHDTAWIICGDGRVGNYFVNGFASDVAPAIYLKSNVLIESGTGTSSDPYILKAGA